MKRQRMNWINIKNYIAGGTAVVLAIVCFFAILIKGYEKRLLMAGIFLLLMGCFSLYIAIKEQKRENLETKIDESNEIIHGKNTQLTIQIINRLLFSFTLLCILLYGITKIFFLFFIGVILCGITVLILLVLFIQQKMSKKKN